MIHPHHRADPSSRQPLLPGLTQQEIQRLRARWRKALMVASISARGSVAAASAYYKHMAADEYYAAAHEAEGEWAGRGAERLALERPGHAIAI